jgi:hypothetical protein
MVVGLLIRLCDEAAHLLFPLRFRRSGILSKGLVLPSLSSRGAGR